MIISSFFNIFLICVISGYSFVFKKIFLKNRNVITNLDLLYGLIFLIFISLFINFFSPLKYFSYTTIILGFIIFIYALIKKSFKINFILHFLIIFSLTFIIYHQGDNVDTPMYHLQIIKWLYNEKIVFGLSNLEIRFGSTSVWFNLIALLKFKFNDFNNIYTFNLIPFSLLIYQIFEKKNKLSFFFLLLSISFLLFFSLLHPFGNGIILNHLHNTELDTVGMVFFVLSFFLFLKFLEQKDITTLRLLVVSSSICIFIKLSYIAAITFILFALIQHYKKNIKFILKEKIIIFLIILLVLWFLKNLINSGCLIFPVTLTCLSLDWAPNINEIDFHNKETKGFARDTRERLNYTNFEYTINSLQWFIPWFKDYALNTAFLKISFFVSFFSMIFLIIFNFFKLLNNDFQKNFKKYLLIYLIFLPCFFVWFQAPEIRFGWGTFISFSCFSVAIFMYHFKINKSLKLLSNLVPIILLFFLIIDNKNNFSFENLINPYKKNIEYSNIVKIKDVNGFDIYKSINWQCFDFDKICVNSEKENYYISRENSYLIIK